MRRSAAFSSWLSGPKRLSAKIRRGGALAERTYRQFGALAAAASVLDRVLNAVIRAESLKIIVRERSQVRLDPETSTRFTYRPASRADLEAMRLDPRLDIDESKLRRFDEGDLCLLSFVDGEIAGYTWSHHGNEADLMPGLRISVPSHYFYDYAALTLPEFRGLGLHALRQDQLFETEMFSDKAGLIGFVRSTNYPMLRTLPKRGNKTVGTVWLIGGRRHFLAVFSRSARRLGMRRLES